MTENSMHEIENGNAPVFSLDEAFETDGLPALWITAPGESAALGRTGRVIAGHYPELYVIADDDEDEDFDPAQGYPVHVDEDAEGWLALDYGSRYYREAMDTQDAALHQVRVDCFRAAELLYLWAAGKGNPQAFSNLGYVYSYNRCEGAYLGLDEHGARVCEEGQEFPREKRAFECFEAAAKAGQPEAHYKLGDLLAKGRGCEASPERAIQMWKQGFKLAQNWDVPTWWGASALRLGSAFEEGRGCEQSFEEAAMWYGYAEQGLNIAVEEGDWYYEKSLASARAGLARCKQELDG